MSAHPIILALVIGYFLGSIPFGYLLVRIFYRADVRTTGSGNIGATNVARTSPLLGIVTLMLDAGKGLAAVLLTFMVFSGARPLAFVAAFASVCGHIFPLWIGFRGGKGVATGLGGFLLLTPKAILIAIGVFLVVLAAFRWVALASVMAAGSLPLLAWALQEVQGLDNPAAIDAGGHLIIVKPLAWLSAASLLIIVKHHSNIRRIISSTEPKFQLKRK